MCGEGRGGGTCRWAVLGQEMQAWINGEMPWPRCGVAAWVSGLMECAGIGKELLAAKAKAREAPHQAAPGGAAQHKALAQHATMLA